MFDYDTHFSMLLDGLKAEGRYRSFRTLERLAGRFPRGLLHHTNGTAREVTIWCSNDYLGMGHHPRVVAAMKDAIDRHGAGAGGTRNIAGTTAEVVALEALLACHHKQDAALVFTSGYTANEGALGVLSRMMPGAIVFSDALNHASMIAGMKGAQKEIFPHNDVAALTKMLAASPAGAPKIVAIESVYSMEGDIAPLKDIVRVAKHYGALLYLDEVHAVGMYGAHGAGIAERDGVMEQFDMIEGTFGKAYGLSGGYIAGKASLVDAVRSFASSFIFTTALPPAILAGAIASIEHLRQSDAERTQQRKMADRLKFNLTSLGLPVMEGKSHIIPLVVGDAHCCKAVSDQLLERHDIYVQPINYPTVPRGTERLRLTPTACHQDKDVDALTGALQELWAHHALQIRKSA